MSVRRLRNAALILLAAASPVFAQDSTRAVIVHVPSQFELRSAGSIAFIQSRPNGALGNNIGFGYGVNAAYLFRLDSAGWLSLRFDGGFLQYGSESKRVPLSNTIGGRILVDVSTDNNIVPLSLGLQLGAPRGRVRPYVNAGLGGQFFYTQSHVEGSDDNYEFASTTNQWDNTGSWVGGGGVYIPLNEGRTKVMLDIGAQYVSGGRARYLKPGSIQDLPNNQIQITPMESETHMTLVRIGVKVSL
jgi:opacity protein-like surface antigen